MTEDKKAKLEKCALLKANGGRCHVDGKDIVLCDLKKSTECPCYKACGRRVDNTPMHNPSPELIAARLAAVAEYEAKCAEQPHKLITPTRDQLLTWVCSTDALGWVVAEYLDYLDMTMALSVNFCDYAVSIDSYQFSRTSLTGEYIWNRPMWDSVAGKIVMVPVEG